MAQPQVSIIAAIGEGRELGKNNKLLWHFPEDMKYFKEKTQGHVVIMGRKTYESIGRLLPQRTNIIISRNPDLKIEGTIIAHSLEEALDIAKKKEKEEIFIIGGAQIYREALPIVDKLYLTLVRGNYEADVFFPEYQSLFPKVLSKKEIPESRLIFLELAKEK